MNALVADAETHSNAGGQCSKSTPAGSTAMFASGGKKQAKKNIGEMLKCYAFSSKLVLSQNFMAA